MEHSSHTWWFWTRAVLAAILAALVVAIALPSAGRVVIDSSTTPPTHHAVWGVREYLPSVGLALFSLACIYVGMWKRWSFEIVGWTLLLVFIFVGMFAA
jgi:hypothetical protein